MKGRLTVALDITVTEDLRKEGLARELVNRIQNLRKSSGFDITDKIHVSILSCEEMDSDSMIYKDYIRLNQVIGLEIYRKSWIMRSATHTGTRFREL